MGTVIPKLHQSVLKAQISLIVLLMRSTLLMTLLTRYLKMLSSRRSMLMLLISQL